MALGPTSTLQSVTKGNDMGGAVSSVVDKVGDIGQSVGGVVNEGLTAAEKAAVSGLSLMKPGGALTGGSLVGDVLGTVGDIGQGAIDTAKDMASSDLGKAALLAGGAYMAAPYLMGTAATTGTGLTAGGGLGLTGAGTTAYGGLGAGLGSTLGTEAALTSGLAGSTVGGLGLTAGGTALGGLGAGLGGSAATTAAGAGLLGTAANWASANPLQAAGLGLIAAKALGGSSTPSSSTSSTSIDPEMKAAYLRNLEEARTTAAGLGTKQFAAFPTYSNEVVNQYMNPYQQQVIDTTLSDIERQRQQAQLRDRAAAVQAKAFGGSRQGVAEALTNEAYQRTAANTVANLRSQGFTNAQAIALQQEEAKRQYEQQKLDAVRNLGLERLNISQSALGLQPANLGGTQTTPIYSNPTASALGGALSGGMLGNMIGGATGAGYGAAAGGLLGLLK